MKRFITLLVMPLAINSVILGDDGDACLKAGINCTEIAYLDTVRKIEEEFLSLPREFLVNESQCNDGSYEKFNKRIEAFGEQYEALGNKFEALLKELNFAPSNNSLHRVYSEYDSFFAKLREIMRTKYWKDYLLNHGMRIVNSGLGDTYKVFFEEERHIPCEGKKTIRYRISPLTELRSFCEDIKNVNILLLNENKFEVFRFYVGAVSKDNETTGKFEIPESYYQEFNEITLVGDTATR